MRPTTWETPVAARRAASWKPLRNTGRHGPASQDAISVLVHDGSLLKVVCHQPPQVLRHSVVAERFPDAAEWQTIEGVGDVQGHRQHHSAAAHGLLGHGPKAHYGIDRRTPRSETELGVRQIGANLAKVPDDAGRKHPLKKFTRLVQSNYRPTITPLFSKIMESVINCQLLRYLKNHQLLNDR
ncbi:unnamed protein product [Arctia plantaginis]|uniref:Uncharacterized protein n=1 Tax=Arctia plantaginis TaxID=874455 RepID=A0A8S1AD42_ARCPL|nr:unnamed protein product [Arctia plantaginis]